MPDRSRRKNFYHAFSHRQTCAKNRDYYKIVFIQNFNFTFRNRRFNLNFFRYKIFSDFVSHQHRNIFHQLAKTFCSGIFISEFRQLMRDNRMRNFMYHKPIPNHKLFFKSHSNIITSNYF